LGRRLGRIGPGRFGLGGLGLGRFGLGRLGFGRVGRGRLGHRGGLGGGGGARVGAPAARAARALGQRRQDVFSPGTARRGARGRRDGRGGGHGRRGGARCGGRLAVVVTGAEREGAQQGRDGSREEGRVSFHGRVFFEIRPSGRELTPALRRRASLRCDR